MDQEREYLNTHPWITFNYAINQDRLWTLLGEAYSKCKHLAGTPLQPGLASELSGVYLVKGAVATTAIEGNTLTEEEVVALLDDKKKLPPSQQYLEDEVRNVIAALAKIDETATNGDEFRVAPEWIKEQNLVVLAGLEAEPHVVPGEYTTDQLVVGNYRGAPPRDIDYLMGELCTWLDNILEPVRAPHTTDEMRFFNSFFAATLGHLYIAWIHPFGDGNGRTARLLECAILAHSRVVPWVSSNLLSDHYNRTRTRYYARLQQASRSRDVMGFLTYSAEGFVDMLREQILKVRHMQRRVAWINYVHERFAHEPPGASKERRREIALNLREDEPTSKREFRRISADVATLYAGKSDKTITRDITRLRQLGLIRFERGGYVPRIDQMDAFRPIAAEWADDV